MFTEGFYVHYKSPDIYEFHGGMNATHNDVFKQHYQEMNYFLDEVIGARERLLHPFNAHNKFIARILLPQKELVSEYKGPSISQQYFVKFEDDSLNEIDNLSKRIEYTVAQQLYKIGMPVMVPTRKEPLILGKVEIKGQLQTVFCDHF